MDRNIFGISENDVHAEAQEILVKQDEYKKYIDTHIENVRKSALDMLNNPYFHDVYANDLQEPLAELEERVKCHDESKYSDEEFEAYRKNFYPSNPQEQKDNEEDFEIAWKHHYLNNDHHPEHWMSDNGPIDMPMAAILEMICDWDSFKYIGKGNAKQYWNSVEGSKKKDAKYMSENTVKAVNRIIGMLSE